MPSCRLPLLAALLIFVPSTLAEAAILIEARKEREALRMVIDAGQQRAMIETPRGRSVIDLESGRIYAQSAGGAARQLPIAADRGARGLPGDAVGPGSGDRRACHGLSRDHLRRRDLRRDAGERLDAAVHGAGGAGPGRARRHGARRRRRRLRAHSVSRVRRSGLADAGRQDRSPDLRDHGDPIRLRAALRRAGHLRRRLARPRSAKRSGRTTERRRIGAGDIPGIVSHRR